MKCYLVLHEWMVASKITARELSRNPIHGVYVVIGG